MPKPEGISACTKGEIKTALEIMKQLSKGIWSKKFTLENEEDLMKAPKQCFKKYMSIIMLVFNSAN